MHPLAKWERKLASDESHEVDPYGVCGALLSVFKPCKLCRNQVMPMARLPRNQGDLKNAL